MEDKSEDNGTLQVSAGFPARRGASRDARQALAPHQTLHQHQGGAIPNYGLSLSSLLGGMASNEGGHGVSRETSNPGLSTVTQQVLLKALSNQLSSSTVDASTSRSSASGDPASSGLTALPPETAQLLQSLLLQQNQALPNAVTNLTSAHSAAALALLQASRLNATPAEGELRRHFSNPINSQASLSSTIPLVLGQLGAAAAPLLPSSPPPVRAPATAPQLVLPASVQSSRTTRTSRVEPTGMVGSSSSTPLLPEQSSMDKKTQKRAANRISAQQSRRRKQRYIDDLREENEELRKINHVLSLLPDLILTFDSSGVIRFVSHASMNVFGSTPNEVEGTSFWSWICSKSSRRLKAAFMDALASQQRNDGCTSVSLGKKKIWEIRIKKRREQQEEDQLDASSSSSSSWETYTLHGIVHFGGEGLPECICTIRLGHDASPNSTTVPLQEALG